MSSHIWTEKSHIALMPDLWSDPGWRRKLSLFDPIQTRLFWVLRERGGGIPSPPLNSENIKAMTTKLKGQIVSPKVFPLRSTTSADDVM